MFLFNTVLLLHFAAFILYLCQLVLLFPKQVRKKNPTGVWLGVAALVTGVLLVVLKYPAINYYKVVPKTALLLGIAVINGLYSKKPLSRAAYYLLLVCTLLAACIAVIRV